MPNEPRGCILPEYIESAKQGEAPGVKFVRDLFGEGSEVIISDGEAFQIMRDEEPIREGYLNLRACETRHQNLVEVDDREAPPVEEDIPPAEGQPFIKLDGE